MEKMCIIKPKSEWQKDHLEWAFGGWEAIDDEEKKEYKYGIMIEQADGSLMVDKDGINDLLYRLDDQLREMIPEGLHFKHYNESYDRAEQLIKKEIAKLDRLVNMIKKQKNEKFPAGKIFLDNMSVR